MPVFVECPTQLSVQDRQDVQRIYADAPAAWQLSSEQVEPWLNAALAAKQLIVGRFNGRLLGACSLRQQGDGLYVSHLCVRAMTRKRGVGRRIWDEVLHQAATQGRALYLIQPDRPSEAQLLAPKVALRDLL